MAGGRTHVRQRRMVTLFDQQLRRQCGRNIPAQRALFWQPGVRNPACSEHQARVVWAENPNSASTARTHTRRPVHAATTCALDQSVINPVAAHVSPHFRSAPWERFEKSLLTIVKSRFGKLPNRDLTNRSCPKYGRDQDATSRYGCLPEDRDSKLLIEGRSL